MNTQLSSMETSQAQDIQADMSVRDLNNPEKLLDVQEWTQQYSIEVGFQSAMIKMVKDLLQGIISKI
jgi:type III secretion protein F